MSQTYSIEDKSLIKEFVSANSLDVLPSAENDEKWQELGALMNRDWEEIREMYGNWKNEDNLINESAEELENNNQNLDSIIEEFFSSTGSTSCDVIEYINFDGQLIKTDQVQYVMDAPLLPLTNQNDNTGSGPSSSQKRPHEVLEIETNSKLVNIFEQQSLKELELKRQEHEEKMMIYKQQLVQGAELHKERMKILKAKLKAIEEKVEDIDNLICNKNLRKKFKKD